MDNETTAPGIGPENTVDEQTEQFVTFMIASERFGVDILRVRDIIDMTEITQVPRSPRFLKGVINLRGAIVPVVDTRLKFNMEEQEYHSFTVIIVVEVRGKLIGMIVDSVSDVVTIALDSIHESSHFKTNIRDEFIRGIGRLDDQLIIIIDVDKIFLAEAR